MSEYVKDAGLVADCRKCCVKAEEDTIKYTSAILEVCPYRLNGLPAIKDFIDKHSTQYGKALRVSRTMGAYPKFILQQELGATKSVRIDQWKVEAMHEFLQSRLELGNTKKKAATALS